MTRGQKIAAGVVVVGLVVVVALFVARGTAEAAASAGAESAAQTFGAAARTVIGTMTDGSPIYGRGNASDKTAPEVARRAFALTAKDGG
ncbi:MAG: hypothetical protein RIS45_1910 [Planctomycetota bacterium]